MSGRAYLFLEADRRVYRCQFTKDLTLIGSASDADIIIRDSQVLPQHAQIAATGTTFTLRRIDRSEVRVDGVRIEGPHELVAGERIGIGDTEILFVREEKLSPVCLELVIERPGDVPVGFWTAKSTVTIGRERGDLILDDPLLSRVHCVIENYCEGGQFLLDARSERGTALNGVAIDTRHLLKVGDVIQIGNIRVVVGIKTALHAPSALSSAAAQDRVAALRDRGDPDAPPRGDPSKAVPRNPYQRYPSEVSPDPAPPALHGSHESGVPRRGSVDLRSGVSTGIVDPSLARRLRSRDPDAAPRPAPADPSPAPRAGRREPEALPRFEARPGWGDPAKNAPSARGFDDVSTRISHVGNEVSRERGSGLWYLPQGSRAAPTDSPRPIIRPRGDMLPPEPPTASWDAPPRAPTSAAYDEPGPVPESRRPIIRRPSPAGPPEFRGPTSSSAQPHVRNEAPDLTIGRQPEPVPSSRRADGSRHGESRHADPPRSSSGDRDALGARAGERWYTPEHAGARQERRPGEPMYYLPETKNRPAPRDDLEDAPKSPQGRFRRPSFGGRTQGFDPSDY